MSEVRLLEGDDFDAFVTIVANAYPDFELPTVESRQEYAARMRREQRERAFVKTYGLFRDGLLLGGMRLLDFTMNMVDTRIPVGGVGLVAVDIMHKKEKVAKDMITFFLRHSRERGAPLASLYPFRPDFYKQMGFGYGTKMNQYTIKPSQLPKTGERTRVRLLSTSDIPALLACYTRTFEQTHGLFAKQPYEFERLFEGFTHRAVGYERDGALHGYAFFLFKKGKNPLDSVIEVRDLVYEDREALAGLLAFFQSQADQSSAITINTQDALFHHLLFDPRNGGAMHVPPVAHESNTAGVGVMYRVINTLGFFETLRDHSFGDRTGTLAFNIHDDFLPENNGSTLVHFAEGRPTVLADGSADAEIQMHVSEFSSLVMGVIPFSTLHLYGLAEISNVAAMPLVDRIFATARPPVCMTRF